MTQQAPAEIRRHERNDREAVVGVTVEVRAPKRQALPHSIRKPNGSILTCFSQCHSDIDRGTFLTELVSFGGLPLSVEALRLSFICFAIQSLISDSTHPTARAPREIGAGIRLQEPH
jgi:hypothetical protein